MSTAVSIEYRGRIAIITISKPEKLNAMSGADYFKLMKSMKEIEGHDEVFITMLIGKGTFFFCVCFDSFLFVCWYGAVLPFCVVFDIAPVFSCFTWERSTSHMSTSTPAICIKKTFSTVPPKFNFTNSPPKRGADVSISRDLPPSTDPHEHWLRSFVSNNLSITEAFYNHPKILITALNGPAIGLSAAVIAWSDFIYCTPHAYLLTPFSSLGLVTEGGASVAFVNRLGASKANEALIMSKRITSDELLRTGFVNKIFPCSKTEDAKFKDLVLHEIDERLGTHLVGNSLTEIKKLIRRPERAVMEGQGVAEVMKGLELFISGVPQAEFKKIASGQKRHKL